MLYFLPLYAADAHQDFYMRIAMRISAYADHPHEPHGSATAWPSSQSSLAVRFTAKNGGYPGDVKL